MGSKAQARRRKPRVDRFDLDDFEPIRLEPASQDEEEPEEIHAFSIGDVDYYVPTAVPFHCSVQAMEIYAQRGEAAAITYTLRTVLGDEAYEALINYKGLSEANFEAIVRLTDRIIKASGKGSQKPSAGSGG